jgi:hypothetical protein
MYDSIEIFDFPTRVDGTSEGYASMTFSSDTVANIVVGALQARGFGAYLEHEHMNAYVQSLILTQPYAPISQQAWSAPRQGPRQAVFSVPIPRVPKVAQATKTVRTPKAAGTSSTVPKAKVVRQLPKVQIFEVTQPSLVTPLSPILGPGPAFHLPRSAPVANGYDSWHGIGSADEDGRRSV